MEVRTGWTTALRSRDLSSGGPVPRGRRQSPSLTPSPSPTPTRPRPVPVPVARPRAEWTSRGFPHYNRNCHRCGSGWSWSGRFHRPLVVARRRSPGPRHVNSSARLGVSRRAHRPRRSSPFRSYGSSISRSESSYRARAGSARSRSVGGLPLGSIHSGYFSSSRSDRTRGRVVLPRGKSLSWSNLHYGIFRRARSSRQSSCRGVRRAAGRLRGRRRRRRRRAARGSSPRASGRGGGLGRYAAAVDGAGRRPSGQGLGSRRREERSDGPDSTGITRPSGDELRGERP